MLSNAVMNEDVTITLNFFVSQMHKEFTLIKDPHAGLKKDFCFPEFLFTQSFSRNSKVKLRNWPLNTHNRRGSHQSSNNKYTQRINKKVKERSRQSGRDSLALPSDPLVAAFK